MGASASVSTSAAYATAGATAVSYGIDAFSQYQAGRRNERLARLNAGLAEDQAATAERKGKIIAQRARNQGAQVIGAQRAALAANGIRVDSALAQHLALDSGMAAELDALEIENQAAMEAMGYRLDAAGTRTRGALDRAQGESQAVSTAVRGVADTYQTYRRLRS